jgi:hypothetical protein
MSKKTISPNPNRSSTSKWRVPSAAGLSTSRPPGRARVAAIDFVVDRRVIFRFLFSTAMAFVPLRQTQKGKPYES